MRENTLNHYLNKMENTLTTEVYQEGYALLENYKQKNISKNNFYSNTDKYHVLIIETINTKGSICSSVCAFHYKTYVSSNFSLM